MGKDNFWRDVLLFGAILGVVAIVFDLMGMLRQNMVLSVGSLLVFILLVFYFTKRRVTLYGAGEEGYTYGRCLGFIACMMVVAGVIEGIYMYLAMNFLFVEHYEQMLSQSLAALESSGMYNAEQIELVMQYTHSPWVLILGGTIASVFKGVFFGLFIAAIAKRDPVMFADDNEA